jgi:hypothetical protein
MRHPDVIASQVRLGEALTESEKPREAAPVLWDALASAESAPFPLLPWQVAEAGNALGGCWARLSRSVEATNMLRQSKAALTGYPEAALRRRAMRRINAVTNNGL